VKDLILGIETSCDDTCACLMSVVDGKIIYNRSIHQDETHAKFGGIVPNLAAGEHLKHIEIIRNDLLKQDLLKLAGVAVTTGPGLIGSLLVGVSFAKGLAVSLGIPLFRINHLEGHAVSCMIENDVKFPFLLLLVSGGNSQIILANDLGNYEIIGETLDDAGGEALDKIAKTLGISYPGAINMEKVAECATNKSEFSFKDGCINGKTFNFSFSGLKTQILYKVKSLCGIDKIDENTIANIAYSGQEAVFNTFTKKLEQTFFKHEKINNLIRSERIKNLVICGGVSANKRLSQKINDLVTSINKKLGVNIDVVIPSLKYTTDNGAMIAKAGCLYWQKCRNNKVELGNGFGYCVNDLSFSPTAKWRIDEIKGNISKTT